MARGRGGSYDSGVVILTRRREVDVDPDLDFRDAKKAQRISDYAEEDAQNIYSKSRMKDRQLLNNLTQKLHANNVYAAPLSHTRTPKNDYIPRSNARRLSQPRVLPESVLFIRAGSLPPRSTRTKIDYDDDIADIEASLRAPTPPPPPPPIYRKTPRRFVKRRPVRRASSEPPPVYRPPPTPSTPLPISPTYLPDPGYTGVYPLRYASSDARPAKITPSSMQAVRNAKRYLDRIERELGVVNAPSVAEPIIIHHVNAAPSRIVPRTSVRVAAGRAITPRVRSSSLPPPPKATSRAGTGRGSRVANIEARLVQQQQHDYDNDYPETITLEAKQEPLDLSELRQRTNAAKNKLDSHKVLMDRYLPIYFGPENEVQHEVDYKYGELVNRMPALDKYRPTQGGVTLATIPPYKPATKSKPPVNPGPPRREGFRPVVSDTRKRIREVLCATKKDPHYFD